MSQLAPALADSPHEALAQTTYPVHGVDRTFFYRPGTSDEGVIGQMFAQKMYSFDQFPFNYAPLPLRRDEFVKKLYDKITATGKPPLIIDGGANIGASSLYFADAYPDAHVVAVEPEQSNFDLLQKNTTGLSIECHRAAISAEGGHYQVVDTGGGNWTYRAMPIDLTRNDLPLVKRVTINDLYGIHALMYTPFIAKLDIEGGEADVFSANTEWARLTPIIMIEVHDWLFGGQAVSRPFLQCISQQNRDFIHVGENIFSISNEFNLLDS